MAKLFVRLMLGLLTTVAVVLPFLLNKQNYDPALQKAHDAVQQTKDRADAMEAAIAGTGAEPQEATEAAPSASQPARLQDTLDKLSRQRQDLADQ